MLICRRRGRDRPICLHLQLPEHHKQGVATTGQPELLDNSSHQIPLIHGITTIRLKAIQIIVVKNLDYIVQRPDLLSLVEERREAGHNFATLKGGRKRESLGECCCVLDEVLIFV
jgi:hypothetical protein